MNHALIAVVVWAVLTLGSAYLAWEMVRSARSPEGEHAFPDRWNVVSRAAFMVLAAGYTLIAVAWLDLTVALWWINVAVTAIALAAGAARWHTLPWSGGDDGARGRRLGALFSSGLTVAAVLFFTL